MEEFIIVSEFCVVPSPRCSHAATLPTDTDIAKSASSFADMDFGQLSG